MAYDYIGNNGSFEFQDANKQFTWRVNWQQKYDIGLNSSIIEVSIDILSRVYGGSWYPNGFINVNGERICEMDYYEPTHIVKPTADNTTWKPITNYKSSATALPVSSSPIAHNADGSKSITIAIEANPAGHNISSIQLYNSTYGIKTYGSNQSITAELAKIPRAAEIVSAPNFNDSEYNPTITYSSAAGEAVDALEAFISLDGESAATAYYSVNKTGTSYQFTLSEAEMNTLRNATNNGSTSRTIYYCLRTTIGDNVSVKSLPKTFTVINAEPEIGAFLMDTSGYTNLTGDAMAYLIKGLSNASYEISGTAKKGASIVSYAATNGIQTFNTSSGVFYGTQSASFTFTVKDSRGLTASTAVVLNLIDYIYPSVSAKAAMAMEGETTAKASITITGNVFDGSFGNTDNYYALSVLYTGLDDWKTVGVPSNMEVVDNTYTVVVDVAGLDYTVPFVFKAKIADKITSRESDEGRISINPVFDWSNNDFNFNVPIHLNNNLAMRQTAEGKTILHSNNNDFHIWTTPDNYSAGHFIVKANDGGLVYNGKFLDYVVERGSEAMGSNGTWYWEKWQSGRAICYGTRNFGKAAITSAFGSIYKTSTIYSQDLPSGLFNNVPIYIGREVLKASDGSFQVWSDGSGTMLPTKDNTGGFFLTRPTSYTTWDSYISFYVVGSWK